MGNRSQSRDKMLQILLRIVLYPTMMVAIALARQNGQCWQVHAFYLVSLLFIAMLASVSFPSCFVTFYSSGRSLLPFLKSRFLNCSCTYTCLLHFPSSIILYVVHQVCDSMGISQQSCITKAIAQPRGGICTPSLSLAFQPKLYFYIDI